MLSNLIAFILIYFAFYLVRKYREYSIIYLPILYFIYDIFSLTADRLTFFGISRLVVFGVFITFYLRHNGLKILFKNPFFPFLLYTFLLTFFSSDILESLNGYSKSLVILLTTSIAFYSSMDVALGLRHLKKSAVIVLVLYLLNGFVSSVFAIGTNPYYSLGVHPGSLTHGLIYIVPLAILFLMFANIGFFQWKTNKYQIILTVLSLILVLLSGRRTAMIVFILGLLIYLFYFANFSKNFFKYLGFILVFITFGIFFLEDVYHIYAARQYYYSDAGGLEGETRYKETEIIFHDFINSEIIQKAFGQEIYNSVGNYGDGDFGNRVIHLDFNLILHGSGIIGFSLYLLAYFKILRSYFNRRKLILNKNSVAKRLYVLGLLFVFLSVVFSLSSGFYVFTFRSYLFLLVGFCLNPSVFFNPTDKSIIK